MRKFLVVLVPGLLVLVSAIVFPALSASAAHPGGVRGPWSYIWRPGRKLPGISPDMKVEAWPAQQRMDHLRPGQTVPMITLGGTAADGQFVQTASPSRIAGVTSRSGLVNIEAVPRACEQPVLVKHLGLRWVTVGATYSLIRPVTQEFDYEAGQSSGLSVGSSGSGDFGTFQFDGSTSVSSNFDQGFPENQLGNERYYTKFVFGKFQIKCESRHRYGSSVVDKYYIVKPYEWAGGDLITHPKKAPRAIFCVPEAANRKHSVTVVKKTTNAENFSAGFSVLGFTGAAETGYDNQAIVKFTWAKGSHGHLCGIHDYPAGDARELVAKR